MRAFGPVPSRRLGRSLGVNNIPPKVCTYSCVYCQVGRTTHAQVEPSAFYDPEDLVSEVRHKIEGARRVGEDIDYITFVPDGEPTLDKNLGTLISMLKKELRYPVAVITNGSTLWREEVAEAVSVADWVSVKVDSVVESIWRRNNRPDRRLEFPKVLEGIRAFASRYQGQLVSETMLVDRENTDPGDLAALADYLSGLSPETAYLSASELARQIREKKISPVEVTAAVLQRAERAQPLLNAFITICADQAMSAARTTMRFRSSAS